ncbi:MAG: complement resistance protein TraT, partial [Muribaculaceae bacterium]|nr:complement resistance protein TraT [Muribaculaceae bacterium]
PHRRQEAIAQAVDAEGYTIIDDPDEAARILSGAQKRYSNAVAMTEKAFVRATDAFDTAENILCATIKNC